MTVRFSAPAWSGAGALLCALFLAGCDHPNAPPPAAPDIPSLPTLWADGPAAPREASDPLAAAKRADAPATPTETQAARDLADNVRSRALARNLAAHPDWLARQSALCGPGDATLQARYATLKGPPPDDLRDLKVACMAKDIAERASRDLASGGVKNTGTL